MRRLLLAGVPAGHAGDYQRLGDHSEAGSPAVIFFVCVFVLPAALAVCTSPWRWVRRLWRSDGELPAPQAAAPSTNGQTSIPSASSRPPAAPASQDSVSMQGTGDTSHSNITTNGPTQSARPGQPANPVSLPGGQQAATDGKARGQPGTEKAAPGPSYESDDEDGGRGTAEERLNEITKSVKGHANAAGAGSPDEAARRVAEEAAKRLAAERGLQQPQEESSKAAAPSAASVVATAEAGDLAAAAGLTSATAPPGGAAAGAAATAAAPGVAAAALPPPASAPGVLSTSAAVGAASAPPTAAALEGASAGVQQEASAAVTYEVDLDIDLTKGDLKIDYSTRGLLGQGGFAAVYKGRYKGQRVAVKMIKKTAGSSLADLQEDMNALMHELHILRQVIHPNIVTLFGGCLKPPHIFLVEERMEGTLDFYVHQVRKHDALSVREVVYFALDVACGLSYLHPRIVHRDLKPANVLLSREGRCKISDFGLARTKMKEYLSTKNLDAGTTAYIAPECFMSMDNPDMHDLRRSVTDRTDIYALGVIMWEMLAGKRPWQGLKPLLVAYQVAYRSLRPPLFELGARCPPKLRQLIEECWCQEPKQRPSSQQVVDRLLEILNELPPEQDFPAFPEQQPAPPVPEQQQQQQQQQVISHEVVSPGGVVFHP
ncbi:hypothetical protein PLESTB_000712600 [Pleodorina starrii]|uniref:Protein kinase domain-containing protein n=1 Tax=Pleodorina starrii TaxID=330485 RepID=A0A9W6F1Q6_9CHLO|nr:hypothetical protein PLESTB_000056700 [Pleodorina starrii]GLC53142.1 hypothetical protein PLESTB_000712600 [Pleodorina starrii]GLC68079.1 hypothetical protein PLESTF_000643800 [Pleodorina starrii]